MMVTLVVVVWLGMTVTFGGGVAAWDDGDIGGGGGVAGDDGDMCGWG